MYPLHIETLKLVKEERRLTGLVIEALQKIADEKVFLKMGYSSLFEYATKALGYSEACAYRRIACLRISKELPEVKEKLDNGSLNLTTITMAQTLFKKENLSLEIKRDVIEKIEHKSKIETEKILATYTSKDLFKTTEKLTIISETKTKIQLTVNQELINKLNKIKSLRSHKNPNMSYEDLLNDMSDYILKKIDPTLKKVKAHKTESKNIRYVPANLKKEVFTAYKSTCSYKDPVTNHKCTSQHLLEIDHIKPIYAGGSSQRENLRLLCRAHNQSRNGL